MIEHVLAGRSLRFTKASDFNDPFELFPTMDAYLRPLMSALLLEHAKTEHLSGMRSAIKRLIPNEEIRYDLGRYLEEQLEDETSEVFSELCGRVAYSIRMMTAERKRAFLASMRERLNESFGVLSLSEVPDSILMWSHYADSHKGFVLELDAADAFFNIEIFPGDPLRRVRKVLYEQERPSRACFEPKHWLRSQRSASTDLLEYMAGVLLLTKSSDWMYEREWRMVVPLTLARQTPEGIRVLDLPPRAILRVITGSAMSAADRKRIFEILEHPDFFHVDVGAAVCDTQRFSVVVHEDASVVEKKLLENVERFPDDGIQQRMDRLCVSGPRYYRAQATLVEKGWISVPPYDRSKQKKKRLVLTAAGRARLAERLEAARTWEESCKSDATRLVEKMMASPSDAIDSILAEHYLEMYRSDPERLERQTMAPEVLSSFATLADEDEDVRWNSAKLLRRAGDANVVEHLAAILKWRDFEELAWIHDPHQAGSATREEIEEIEADAPAAYELLTNRALWGTEELTRLAAYALAGIAARVAAGEATDALIEALREPDGDTRCCAVEALGHIASTRALPELERLAKTDREDTSYGRVSDAARVAVRRIREAQKRGRARL